MEESPIIAAVKDDQGLEVALHTECRMVFLLYGNICNVAELVAKLKDAGKIVMVHVDLIDGLAS